jgi:tetratricopeptide (TPR) repeat protein
MAGHGRDVGGVMLWRWLQDWRERRSALDFLRRQQRADEAALAAKEPNLIHLVKFALESGDRATASIRWDEARTLLPNFIYQSRDVVGILLGLERFDEAEAVAREGQRRFPSDRYWTASFAAVAEHRGDLPEAIRRWKRLTNSVGLDPDSDLRAAACLRTLGRLEEAKVLALKAARRDPDNIGAWLELVRLSEQRGDWADALPQWTFLMERFRFIPAIAKQARCLMALGRNDEAQALLAAAWPDHLRDPDIAATMADLAALRSTTPDAGSSSTAGPDGPGDRFET